MAKAGNFPWRFPGSPCGESREFRLTENTACFLASVLLAGCVNPTSPSAPSGGTPGSGTKTTVALKKNTLYLASGDNLLMDAPSVSSTAKAARAAAAGLVWSSSSEKVATVTASGRIVTHAAGDAVITATSSDGKATDSCALTVTTSHIEVSNVSILQQNPSLPVGSSATLSAVIAPIDATNPSLSWESSDTDVATVDPTTGMVTAKSVGKATITATAYGFVGSKSVSCPLAVTEAPAQASEILPSFITLSASALSPIVGATKALTATVSPSTAANRAVTWSSDNSSVASVSSSGLITALAPGSATITATSAANANISASCTVKIVQRVTGVSLSAQSLTLANGDTKNIGATALPANADNKAVIWTCSDGSVVTVVDGVITAVGSGKAIVTAVTDDGAKTASCAVTVTEPVTGVLLSYGKLAIPAGSTASLAATVLPTNATNKTVAWTTSDASVATVGSTGLVSALKAGSATISVITQDGSKPASCDLTVIAATSGRVDVTGVALSARDVSLNAGSSLSLNATVAPSTATDKTLTWNSSDKSVATVNQSGLVSALKAGSADITATSGSASSEVCTVTVTQSVTSVFLSFSSTSLKECGAETLVATVLPADATTKTVFWTSSDESVATVSSKGLVTALVKGSATITATTKDGAKTATCAVIVAPASGNEDVGITYVNMDDLVLSGYDSSLTLAKGKSWTISPNLTGTSYQWILDGSAFSREASCVLAESALTVGSHSLCLSLTDAGGRPFSASLSFTVSK